MDNQTKIIEIKAIESKSFDTATQYKIKADDGLTYKFYTTKQDGNETVAYQQFQDMELKVGSTVSIWYKEMEKEYQGKPYTDRIISSFREAVGKPVPQKLPVAKPPVKEDTDWDEIAVGKCQTAFLAAFIQSGKTFSEAKLQATQARQLAELVVYGKQGTDEVNPVDIPF